MFWRYPNVATSQIDTILEKENVTLTEVLENEGVIQECKNHNKKLVDFLTKPEELSELISLIISEPSKDVDENDRFKLPYIAAEVLSCEDPQICHSISQDEALLDKLFSFLECEPPANPLLASYFSKAFGVLISRKPEQNWYDHQFNCLQIIDFLKKKDFVAQSLRHIGTSAVTDLILRLINCLESGEIKTGILEWLNEKELVQSLIKLIDEKHDRDTHDNASRLVIEILRVSRDGQYAPATDRYDDPLLNTLESAETVELLLGIIFGKAKQEDENATTPPDSVISNALAIILALLETLSAVNNSINASNQVDPNTEFGGNFSNQNPNSCELSPEDLAKQEATVNAILNAIIPWLGDFTQLLVNPPNMVAMKTTIGVLDPPLGQTRLSVTKLICTLLSTNNRAIYTKLKELGTINILLDLFFKYSFNNFLHAQVEECIRLIFAWNGSKAGKSAECAPSAHIRVKTPPTVEMVEHDDDKKSDEGAEQDGATAALEEPQDDSKMADTEPEPSAAAVAEDLYENPLLVDLYSNCRLVERVLEAWEQNESDELKPGFYRKGYMGHLTKIANVMHEHMSVKSSCQTTIEEHFSHYPQETREKWEAFVTGKLAELNEKSKLIPISSYSKQSSSDDEDADFKDIPYPQESSPEAQMFSDYQLQNMSENFVDTFGFPDGAFHENADDDSDDMHRLTTVLSEDPASPSSSDASAKAQGLFESICEQRFTSFPGGLEGDENDMNEEEAEEEEDPWADKTKEINFTTTSASVSKSHNSRNSSDEEEEEGSPPTKAEESAAAAKKAKSSNETEMDVDDEDEDWADFNNRDSSSEVVESALGASDMDTGNPWDSKPLAASTTAPFDNPFGGSPNPSATEAEGWANFSNTNNDLLPDSEMSPAKADDEPAPKVDDEPAAKADDGELEVKETPIAATEDPEANASEESTTKITSVAEEGLEVHMQ